MNKYLFVLVSALCVFDDAFASASFRYFDPVQEATRDELHKRVCDDFGEENLFEKEEEWDNVAWIEKMFVINSICGRMEKKLGLTFFDSYSMAASCRHELTKKNLFDFDKLRNERRKHLENLVNKTDNSMFTKAAKEALQDVLQDE